MAVSNPGASARLQNAAPAVVGLVVAGALLAPLAPGRTWLLDWVIGGKGSVITRRGFGLDGGVVAGLPLGDLTSLITRYLTNLGPLLPLIVIFPLAAVGVARLSGLAIRSALPAVLLFTVNPFVFDRLYAGQVGVLLGYALMPFAIHASMRGPKGKRVRRFDTAIWWAAAALLSVHYLWIIGVVALAVVLQQRLRVKGLMWLVGSVATVAVLSAYLVFAQLGQTRPVNVTAVDLAAYRTQADPHLGLYGNVLGLYGFWRIGPRLAKQDIKAWPFLLALILIIAAVGAIAALRDEKRRPLAVVLLISGTLGFFLALGDQGPTGPIFRALYDHLPLFNVMREPEKFSSLLALTYAVFFGWGVVTLLQQISGRMVTIAVGVLVGALPLDYTPTIFNGLGGQIKAVHVPASYGQANQLIGKGSGEVLALPWHQYESFPFTGRVIANPVPTLFDRDVISGDDVELPGVATTSTSRRSAFLEFVYSHGSETKRFGSLVAPLGLQFVVLSKTVDWRNYGWLDHQQDLIRILDTPELTVYRNTEPVDRGHRVASTVTLPDWGALVALSNTTDLTSTAVLVTHPAPGPVTLPLSGPALPPATTGPARIVRAASPVRLSVPAGAAGLVEVVEPYDAAWRADSRRPIELAQGGMAFPIGGRATSIRFTHWPVTLLGYCLSLIAAGSLLTLALLRRRRNRHTNCSQPEEVRVGSS